MSDPFTLEIPTRQGLVTLNNAPEGYDALVLADVARKNPDRDILVVARDDVRAQAFQDGLFFFAPDIECIDFPAWDCLPYDRVSPNPQVVAARLAALSLLSDKRPKNKPRVIVTTIGGATQKLPPASLFDGLRLVLKKGMVIGQDSLISTLETGGYMRSDTVMEPGEYAVRGGLMDVYPPTENHPVRLDFFGDDLDGLKSFDAVSQRSLETVAQVTVTPVSEVLLDDESISRFRTRYRALFGAAVNDDLLYESVTAGRRTIGIEHWLPLFHDHLSDLTDYLSETFIILDARTEEARQSRQELINEYYTARKDIGGSYNPVPPDQLYLNKVKWDDLLKPLDGLRLNPFDSADTDAVDAGAKVAVDFTETRQRPDANVYDEVIKQAKNHQRAGRKVLIAAVTEGSADRIKSVLKDHGAGAVQMLQSWKDVAQLDVPVIGLVVVAFAKGFVASDFIVLSEQDILGDRLVRKAKPKIKPENIIQEAGQLGAGDLVVHAEHGIGRFEGLETITAAGAPHDCLRLVYASDDRLYLPVETIDLISRFGSDSALTTLDKLGGAGWQARKAQMKKRIRDMADALIKVAAARELRSAAVMAPTDGAFDEFCAGFPYEETEDQLNAIHDVLGDLAGGRPTDRLVCGDVGFGKTEVALRAAFIAAMSGKQVAIVTPTTLLCRQHFMGFEQRMKDFPIEVVQLSRLVTGKKAEAVRDGLKDGTVDIVIGTHALLAKSVGFKDLGLLIVDEEQHFGVKHKERLKSLKSDVHVLTLTATPIPRTMQLAMSGVREMSIIATPPVDRLAVRTYVLPFDPVVIREAILRERYRGGQTFYVCPRVEDLDGVRETLEELVPEIRIAMVHGRLSATALEETVTAFYDGEFDLLLSTNIIESGLDMPSVNTMIIHRADMFGLAQLYQLRGRVGRSKTRAYAYLTLPPNRVVTTSAQKRLDVMQTLDTLGAGFTLASHDMDIRGAGNLLGEEQSGHIREVGIELYQQMLEEAVADARGGGADDDQAHEHWSPQINIGMPVLIPDGYIADLSLRMTLYRRIARLETRDDIDGLAAEMIDRFGPLPDSVENLLGIVEIKALCHRANIEKVEAGPKGLIVAFRNNFFANPAGFIGYLSDQKGSAKLRPDQKLFCRRNLERLADRMPFVKQTVHTLVKLAEEETTA